MVSSSSKSFSVLFFSCDDSDLPKQNGFLRIEFEEPSYLLYNEKNTPLNFYYNSSAINIDQVGSDQFFLDYVCFGFLIFLIKIVFFKLKRRLNHKKENYIFINYLIFFDNSFILNA